MKIWNEKCDNMREIFGASRSRQEFNEIMSAYSNTLNNIHALIVEQVENMK
jgi:hypothetical protein